MRIVEDFARVQLTKDAVLTIGSFDGVHRGHQALVARVVERAQETDSLATVLTFQPHPRQVLAPEDGGFLLTPFEEKARLLEQLGVELLVVMGFTGGLARMSARDFLAKVVGKLRVAELWCGPGFTLGRDGEAGLRELKALSCEFGFRLRVVEPLILADQVVSSTRIRRLLASGAVVQATELLGRRPSFTGRVVAGDSRGRELGFPTANLALNKLQALPQDGFYAVQVHLSQGGVHPGVANIGFRPSFGGRERNLEVHLLDFQEELYEMELKIDFIRRLRGERRFTSPEELVAQLRLDVKRAEQILSGQCWAR